MSKGNPRERWSESFNSSKITTYFKYCSDDDCMIKGIFEDHKIRFTQPAALNDPLEFNPIIRFKQTESNYTRYCFEGIQFPSEAERLCSALIESQLNIYGVLSLTRVPHSFDMWSRYANGHKGFLLELKEDFHKHPSMVAKDGTECEVQKVDYVDEYEINVDDLVNEEGLIPFDRFNKQLFYTKTSRWKKEMEYRMIADLRDHPDWHVKSVKDDISHRDRDTLWLFNFPLECISEVVFGACMAEKKKQEIWKACTGMDIQFWQAYIIRDQKDEWGKLGSIGMYKVRECSEASPWGDLPLMCELDNKKEIDGPLVEITSLEALPYYRIDKERVDLYHKREKCEYKRMKGTV